MIFVLPCKYNQHCLIERAVGSIRNFHTKAKIVVVDSDSDDKSYFDRIRSYDVVIEDVANKNYEPGALWFVHANHQDEQYVLIQDSMVLNQPLQYSGKFKCFINFHESVSHNHMNITPIKFRGDLSAMLYNSVIPDAYTGVFGSSFYMHRELLDTLVDMNLDKTLLPTNKYEHQLAERAFGIAVSNAGIKVEENTWIGNLHDLMPAHLKDNTMNTPLMSKTWINNHRN
jgi:hypothetical protein